MLKPWLEKQYSLADLEARHMYDGKPFGHLNERWDLLKASMQEGDTVWEFSSPPESWRNMAGRAGVALVRDGAIIDVIITMMN